jgi:hypothetical protein
LSPDVREQSPPRPSRASARLRRPPFPGGLGFPSLHLDAPIGQARQARWRGVERRKAPPLVFPALAPCGAGGGASPLRSGLVASRRSTCGDFWLRDRTSGARTEPDGSRSGRIPALHPRRVQPSKAAGRSAGGRRPKASRERVTNPPAGAAPTPRS